MSKPLTVRINHIGDLRKVPIDKLEECLEAIHVAELSHRAMMEMDGRLEDGMWYVDCMWYVDWTDDGNKKVTVVLLKEEDRE